MNPSTSRTEWALLHANLQRLRGHHRDFFCNRCGFEELLLGGRLCERCTLADALARLLDDGTGGGGRRVRRIRPHSG
ncbi:hypothetical protein ACFY0A_39425 [Streptomyces sp. NPDC001698]|uniref:hypothetical protein n=1 Tax=unclassified Streptomyces TaxID=2593676 RepID=UPI0036BC1A29